MLLKEYFEIDEMTFIISFSLMVICKQQATKVLVSFGKIWNRYVDV